MLELMILRHAKSDWGTGVSDHQRTLSRRGRRAAKRMGQFLARAGRVPDLALSSTAVRARTTAESILQVAQTMGHEPPELITLDALYGATVMEWLSQVISAIETAATRSAESGTNPPTRVLVAGHEPTCSGVVSTLTGAHCRFPTGAVATVCHAGTEQLANFSEPSGTLESFVIPRLLDEGEKNGG